MSNLQTHSNWQIIFKPFTPCNMLGMKVHITASSFAEPLFGVLLGAAKDCGSVGVTWLDVHL